MFLFVVLILLETPFLATNFEIETVIYFDVILKWHRSVLENVFVCVRVEMYLLFINSLAAITISFGRNLVASAVPFLLFILCGCWDDD